MRLDYTVVANPDPTNPTLQPPGATVKDDRIFGAEDKQITITANQQVLNRAQFSKPTDSNTLTRTDGGSFSNGDILTLDIA